MHHLFNAIRPRLLLFGPSSSSSSSHCASAKMSTFKMISPETITLKQFQTLNYQYDTLIHEISSAKGAKNGEPTLAELDVYRYQQAPSSLGNHSGRTMDLDMVKILVKWKLRHGKFRPALMNLVSSNNPSTTSEIVSRALSEKHLPTVVAPAIKILTELRGIGVATASLLLAVHNPHSSIFFSDEAFRWLCRGGNTKAPIRYTLPEYNELYQKAVTLAERLAVGAVEVEKAAYVIMKQASGEFTPQPVKKGASHADQKKKNEPEESSDSVEMAAQGPSDLSNSSDNFNGGSKPGGHKRMVSLTDNNPNVKRQKVNLEAPPGRDTNPSLRRSRRLKK